jgi:hypothetical protein
VRGAISDGRPFRDNYFSNSAIGVGSGFREKVVEGLPAILALSRQPTPRTALLLKIRAARQHS